MSRGRRPPLALALRACFHARCALRACFPGRMCDRPFRRVRAKGGLRGGGVARGRMASHARFAIPSLPSRPHASPCRPRFSLGRGQWRNILYVRRRVRIRPGKGAQQERTKYRRGAQRGSRDAGCTQARPALARGARPGPLPSPELARGCGPRKRRTRGATVELRATVGSGPIGAITGGISR